MALIARFRVDGFEPRQVAGLDAELVRHIVPGTGTGDFAGWTGSARIIHDEQGAYFEINLA